MLDLCDESVNLWNGDLIALGKSASQRITEWSGTKMGDWSRRFGLGSVYQGGLER